MERRRAQNRTAQRRFRQRHQQKTAAAAAAAAAGQIQTQAQALSRDTDPIFDVFTVVPSPSETPSHDFFTPSDTAGNHAEIFGSLSTYSTNALLDDISFLEMEHLYSPGPNSTSITDPQALPARTETVEQIMHRFAPDDSLPYVESVNGHHRCKIINPMLSSPLEDFPGPAGWQSPLHIAAQKGHNRIARVLLQHNIDCNEKDSDGLTPLIHATIGGYKDVVSLLLSHGARIDTIDDNRRSALHWAVIRCHEALLKDLLNCCTGDRTLVDGYDKDGRTPLHIAVDLGFEAGVQALLHFGANVHYRARKSS